MSAALKASRRPFRLRAPVVAEHPLQKQICDVLRIEVAPPGKVSRDGVVWWSVDFANYAGIPGTRVARGIIAGVQDFYLLYRGMAHHPELKTSEGYLSEQQKWVSAAVICAGGKVAVVTNAETMLDALDAWGIPRAHRIELQRRTA